MRSPPSIGLFLALALAACGSSGDKTSSASTTGASSTAGTGGGSAASGSSSSGSAGGGGVGGSAGGSMTPNPMFMPAVTGTCPDFTKSGKLAFSPDGKARSAQIYVSSAAAAMDGPIVFFWHGAGGSPTEASIAIGSSEIAAIEAMGGIVAAPYSAIPASGANLPWALCLGGTDESDLRLMDEIVACAIAKVGVDTRRIHSVGFSAGAMNTMQVGSRRSGYIASIVTYSGALLGQVPVQDPTNLFPAMLFDGGPNDQVIVNFQQQTEMYQSNLMAGGQFSFICDHGMGHTVPADGPASAWRFLQDHPFGVKPEPYAQALPSTFPKYCAL